MRGDLAFIQGVIESAYFSVAAGDNYAGIGACDSCSGGFVFASPRDGVRAQIQLLRNYADPDSRADNLTYPPVKGLYPADPVVAARTFDRFFLKGKVPLWNMMGNGHWATDPTYAGKVLGLFARSSDTRLRIETVGILHRDVANLYVLFKCRQPE